MQLRQDRGGFLLSAQGTGVSAFGSPIDLRAARNYGYLEYVSHANSAILILQVSHDLTGWMPFLTVTATTTTGTAQLSAFLPYVRGAYSTGWAATASATMFYSPGLN